MEATHWWAAHPHGFWIIPLAFVIVMCVLAVLVARRPGGWRCGVGRIGSGHDGWRRGRFETPNLILDRRYARGEITKDQYQEMRRDLDEDWRTA